MTLEGLAIDSSAPRLNSAGRCAVPRPDDALLVCVHGYLHAVAQIEFGEDAGDVALDNRLAQEQRGAPHPALLIPPMPTWAMWTVILGWIIGWSAIGAVRMATRDA